MAYDMHGNEPLRLYAEETRSAGETTELFGREKGLLVARPGRYFRPWFSVPEGCYALVTRFGKDFDHSSGSPVWPAGFHFGHPWIKVSRLVSKQSVVFNMPVKGCKTQDNVTVQINLAIVFRIMGDEKRGEDPHLVRKFVYNVGARGLEQQLMDACEETTRTVARTLKHVEVYGLRTDTSGKTSKVLTGGAPPPDTQYDQEGDAALRHVEGPADADQATQAASKGRDVAEDMRRTLNDQFMPQGVSITDVIITDVKLPDEIVKQMAEKTMVIAQNAKQKITQEHDMLTLRQEEEIATLLQRKKEEREKEKQSGDQKVNEVQVQLDKMKAETKVQLARIHQESLVHVQTINADGELEVTKLEQAKAAVLADKKAKAMSDAQKLKAETDLFESTRMSEAKLEAAKNEAKAAEHMAVAEGQAAPMVEARKQYETRLKQMKVWGSLAKNKDLVISGETDPELNTMILSDAILSDKANEGTKSQILSEMLVMQRGSKIMLNLAGNRDE